MSSGSSRVKELNPEFFINFVEKFIDDEVNEVFIRRFISGIYFSLFNYWAAIQYEKYNKRGKGHYQDRFEYSQFHRELLKEGLDAQLIYLFKYRLASDHYMLNPTIVKVYNEEIINRMHENRLEVCIKKHTIKKAIESARDILAFLFELH